MEEIFQDQQSMEKVSLLLQNLMREISLQQQEMEEKNGKSIKNWSRRTKE